MTDNDTDVVDQFPNLRLENPLPNFRVVDIQLWYFIHIDIMYNAFDALKNEIRTILRDQSSFNPRVDDRFNERTQDQSYELWKVPLQNRNNLNTAFENLINRREERMNQCFIIRYIEIIGNSNVNHILGRCVNNRQEQTCGTCGGNNVLPNLDQAIVHFVHI